MVQYDFVVRCIKEILDDKNLDIPEHQRPFIWKNDRQVKLIDTIMSGLPMPNFLYNLEYTIDTTTSSPAPKLKHWLEDAQQRFYSIRNFYDNKFKWNNKSFSELTPVEMHKFLSYKICILQYTDATYDEKIKIFDNFQNGVALTAGQRYHARKHTKLVSYAIERFLTPGKGYYDRMTKYFGEHKYGTDTKTRTYLSNVMGIAGGVAHGVNHITTSYDILGPILDKSFDEKKADATVEHMLDIFENVEKLVTVPANYRKELWKLGKFMGYIIATILTFPKELDKWSNIWTKYMQGIHEGTATIKVLHYNCPKGRNWTNDRWKIGYNNLLNPPEGLDMVDIEEDVSAEDSDDY